MPIFGCPLMSANKEKEGEKICRKDDVISLMSKLLLQSDYADITFLVEGEKLQAHRCILAASSEYFRGLLYGGFSESNQNEIQMHEPMAAFKLILENIYTGQINLADKADSEIMDLLSLAHKFELKNLLSDVIECLYNRINVSNAFVIFKISLILSIKELETKALKIIDTNAMELIKSDNFKDLSKEELSNIIIRNAFPVPELDIFKAVMVWGADKPKEDLQFVLKNVRFTLMQVNEIHEIVEPTGIFDAVEILKVINKIKTVIDLSYRTAPLHRNQLQCITLNDNNQWASSQFVITTPEDQMIFQLKSPILINYVCMDFFGFKSPVSYNIDVSSNKMDWHRIVTYENYDCHSAQRLYFDSEIIRYIYIQFRRGNVQKVKNFLSSYDVVNVPMMIDGIVAPSYNFGISTKVDEKENINEIYLSQPVFVNCIYCEKFSNKEVLKLESSLDGKTYKKLTIQRDLSNKIYFFEAHVLSAVRVNIWGAVKENGDVHCFFNNGKPNFFIK